MSSKAELLLEQLSWALRNGLQPDPRGYLSSVESNLFQPLSARARVAFSKGSGSELRSTSRRPAKMAALHSSAALAVNVFDYWAERDLSQVLVSLGLEAEAASLEFEGQFPTGLDGKPPNVDLVVRFPSQVVVGIESKFSEWMTPKSRSKEYFKAKYFPDGQAVWAKVGLDAAQRLAAALYEGNENFRYLDAAQLLKHMLGLATVHRGKAELYYLFYDWPGRESSIHRLEVERFQEVIAADMRFRWGSYQEIFGRLTQSVGQDHDEYVEYLARRYFADAI